MTRCKSCGVVIRWVVTPRNRRMPLNLTSGRWLRLGDGPDLGVDGSTGAVVRGTFADDAFQAQWETWQGDRIMPPGAGVHVRVFTSHFATCPAAAQHRRRAS